MESAPGYSLDLSYLDCLVDMVPEDPEIQHILSDIDEDLKTNALRVEQCLQKLQSEINETCPSELIQDTAGCLLWLNNCSFNSLKPSSTSHGELLEFLRTLLSLLKKQQMEEEAVLNLLQDISNHCGVLFPRSPSGTSFHFTSRSSLHAVDDDSSMDITSVWDDVRLHLRRFLVDKLQSQQGVSSVQSQAQLRTQCLQHLLFLYPESETLTKYQSIQKKLVMDLLNNRTWPIMDEINFEMVVQSYQRSFSVLYKTIKEDLLLLSGMIEPALAIKFINETFLEPITEEVTSLLKRLGDLHFKEGTRNAVKGIRGKHRGAVHAVDSQEHMKKEINFCLNSHQLKSLSQLVKLLLWIEDRVKELFTETLCDPCYRDIDMRFKGKEKHSQGAPRRGGGQLLAEETKANESSVQPERLLRGAEPAGPRFGWRDALKELSPSVTRSLAAALEDSSSKRLQEEQEQQSAALGGPLALASLRQATVLSGAKHEDERPRQILKFCSDIMEELDTVLPLALACRGESLQEIRATFVEACCKVATAALARLELRSSEVPSKAPVQTLHAALSSAVYLHQRFTVYEGLMGETKKKPLFLVPVQRSHEFISVLRAQITSYCVTVCATSVLQDAESHHWEDKKAFYEGERCSFSIQMWHYFCCGIRHDLWTILPPKTAQEILAEVLAEGLALLSFRYAQAHPSYKRSPQIRIDIATILVCVEHFLWSVCRSVQELCNPTQELCHRILNINIHCNNLLIALFVISAPLKILYKAFQNGFGKHSPPSGEQDFDWRHWLYSMEPCISPSLLKTPSAGEMTTLGQLKLFLSQPYCNQALLLETLLHHDCLIAGILISHSTLMQLQCEDSTNTNSRPSKETSLTEAIFRVLSFCTLSPRSLCTALERCFEEHQLWSLLSKMSVNIGNESEPEVFGCLKRSLIDSVMGIVKQIIALIQACDTKENHGNYLHTQCVTETLLKTIPKEWNYMRKEREATQSGGNFTELAAQAVSIVLAKLPSVIASLLPPVKSFFFLSERKMSEHHPRSKEAGLLVWSTLTIMSQVLKDGSSAEQVTGALLSRWSLERLGTVSACLEAILVMHESSPQEDAQKVLQSIEKQHPRWIQNQMLKAKRLSMEGFPATPEDAAAGEEGACTLGLTEQKINMMVLDICHKPGGSDYLRQIYHIIQLNEEYLKEILISPNNKITTNRPLALDIKDFEERNLIFDPFQAFILPGTTLFNEQSAVNEWIWDWANLLPSCRGLNEATFRAMLAKRWEMKEDADLEEEEKAMVDHLKDIVLTQESSASGL